MYWEIIIINIVSGLIAYFLIITHFVDFINGYINGFTRRILAWPHYAPIPKYIKGKGAKVHAIRHLIFALISFSIYIYAFFYIFKDIFLYTPNLLDFLKLYIVFGLPGLILVSVAGIFYYIREIKKGKR